MTRAFERRAQRVRDATSDLLLGSKLVIWCFEPENMPAMIDLLSARGDLAESDRPHCVHYMTVKHPNALSNEEIAKSVDADEMLQAAGIPTTLAQARQAYTQGPASLKAYWRETFGEFDAVDLAILDDLERGARRSRMDNWGADDPA